MPDRRYCYEKIITCLQPFLFALFISLCPHKNIFANSDYRDIYNDAKNRLSRAIQILESAYEETKAISALESLTDAYLDIAEYDKVISLITPRILEASIHLKLNLARAYYNKQKYAQALKVMDSMYNKLDARGNLLYADICEKLNLYPQAIRAIGRIAKDSPFYSSAQKRIKEITERENYEKLDDIFPKDIIKDLKRATYENFPQAGLVFIRDEADIYIKGDKSVDEEIYLLVKVLNKRGIKTIGEFPVQYDSTDESVQIKTCRIILADGKVIDVGGKHIRDVSLYNDFPLYSNARAKIISIPGLDKNALVEIKYTKHIFRLIDDKFFSDAFYFQSQEPSLFARLRYFAPEDMNLRFKEINKEFVAEKFKCSFSKEKKKGLNVYTWQAKNIPQIIPEPNMVPAKKIEHRVLVSSFSSWQDIYNWWWKLAKDNITPKHDLIKKITNAWIKELKAKTTEEKAKAIYDFCARAIRYVAVEYGRAGYEPHSAVEIVNNMYGDCKDQAILLVSMLRSIGIEAYPVIISTWDNPDMQRDFPAIVFNHAIAVCKLNGKYIYMDPTSEFVPFGIIPPDDQGREVLVFTENGLRIKKTPIIPPDKNAFFKNVTIDITNKEEFSARSHLQATGLFAAGIRTWLTYSLPEAIKQQFAQGIKKVSSESELIKYDVKNQMDIETPLFINLFYAGKKLFMRAGPYRILPHSLNISLNDVAIDNIKYPIDLHRDRASTIVKRKYLLPKNYEVVYLPKDIIMDNEFFKVNYSFRAQKDKNGRLYLTEQYLYTTKKEMIMPKEYGEYKKAKLGLDDALRDHILIRKTS